MARHAGQLLNTTPQQVCYSSAPLCVDKGLTSVLLDCAVAVASFVRVPAPARPRQVRRPLHTPHPDEQGARPTAHNTFTHRMSRRPGPWPPALRSLHRHRHSVENKPPRASARPVQALFLASCVRVLLRTALEPLSPSLVSRRRWSAACSAPDTCWRCVDGRPVRL